MRFFVWDLSRVKKGSINVIKDFLQKVNSTSASYKQGQKWDICKVGDLVKAVAQDPVSFPGFSQRHVGQSQLSKLPITKCRASELKH